ncbi:Do family serine endopeptidase [bacterium]|nr:Do family serine endopeptidase [bacterium]RQV93768.1 MAG: Do family serine endopeptidase [bacterium]
MLSSKTKLWSTAGLVFIGIVIGVLLTSNLNWAPEGLASRDVKPVVLGAVGEPSEALLQLQETTPSFAAVSKEILPTVVSISTSRMINRSQQSDNYFDPLLRDWFGQEWPFQIPDQQELRGLGSGVIVSSDGYILTNNHVIQNADDIKVTLYDNRSFEAELVGTDPLTEIAVIKIDGDNLPVARLGDSDVLEIGDWVLAVGNPFELSSTVTAGIISAKGRSIGIIEDTESGSSGSYAIENFIQTDAVINPGNSGGALVNLKAEVIGINTAIQTTTGYYQGYGFAVPINLAKKIMNDLVNQGYVTRAYLGIGMQPVTEEVAERFGLDRPKGVRIEQVMEDSPAEKAGLKPLDIFLKLDGQEVNQSNEIQNAIALKNPGDVITITVWRNGEEKQIRATLGERDTGRETVSDQRGSDETLPQLGLEVQNLTNDIRSRIDEYRNSEGVIVTLVQTYSNAYDAGIQVNDLIVKIEDWEIQSVSDFQSALRQFEKGRVVIFYMKRGDVDLHAFVRIPE